MLNFLIFWFVLVVACSSFLLGVRIEGCRWRQRCNDMLAAMEAMKRKQSDGK